MNKDLLLLIKKRTDTLFYQTKTKPQETLDFQMNKQMQTFSFSAPNILVAKDKWLLGVTSSECTNSVFNINSENNSFSITTPGLWNCESTERTIDELNILLELRSENDFEQHVEKVKKNDNFNK